MAEDTAQQDQQDPQDAAPQQTGVPSETQATSATDSLGDAGKRAIDSEREARKASEKLLKDAQRELAQYKQASMSESEKAVAEAEMRGRMAAMSEYGKRLASSEMRAAAATAGVDITANLEFLDLGRFVTDDGEPDGKLIGKYISTLAAAQPAPASAPTRRPVEQLHPGATPVDPQAPADDSYPSNWLSPSQQSRL